MEAELNIEQFKQSTSDDHWGDLQDVRPMEVSFNVSKDCQGSAAYSQGETLVLCTIRGPDKAAGWMKASKGAVIQISCRPARRRPDIETTWTEVMCKKMLKRIINVQKFPWSTFRVGIQGVQDGGSMTATMFNAMIFAILNSGLPMKNTLVAINVVFKSDGSIVVDPGEAQEWDSSASLFLVYDTSNFKLVGSQSRGTVDLKNFRLANAVGATAARRLEPFIHQVGGHSSILSLDDSTVCKPLVRREVDFYKSLPATMKEFTAEFKGIVEVSSIEDENGAITLLARAPAKIFKQRKLSRSSTKTRLRILRSGSIEIEARHGDIRFEERDPYKGTMLTSSLNPWVVKCHKQHLNEVAGKEYAESKVSHKFIVLENLASKMKYPCVLDLKMGVRNFGDDAPPSKIESQKAKGAATTTGKLGVRICGMQVYQMNTGGFLCWNKYHGRALTVEGFQDALCQFLDNGKVFRLELVGGILSRLKRLRAALEGLETFRFYCSSLLIIYEGAECPNEASGKIVKTGAWKESANKTSMKLHPLSECQSDVELRVESSKPRAQDEGAAQEKDEERVAESEQKIQVKLIDFAHATCKAFDDTEHTHVGPDRGLIFGLDNLISIFESIVDKYGCQS